MPDHSLITNPASVNSHYGQLTDETTH